jgi:hypothetical protein
MKRIFASLFALAFLSVSAFATDLSVTAASVVAGSSSTVENGTLGATVTAGQLLYKSSTAGTWALADSDSATAEVRSATGIALNGGASGQPVRVLREGTITIGATMTAGVAYYASNTAGGICPVADVGAGEYVGIVGIATSTTVLSVKFHYSGVAL